MMRTTDMFVGMDPVSDYVSYGIRQSLQGDSIE